MYLIATSRCDDPAELKHRPGLWRRVRRFNLPVQMAVAAAEEAAASADDPATAALLSLAPCNSGSAQLFDAIRSVEMAGQSERLHTPRVNPTLTFHAVDNLALSALAITLGNRAYGLGLGGAAGQAWVALEIVRDRLAEGREAEALVVAGDQNDAETGDGGLAVAMLFARRPGAYPPLGRALRLAALERSPIQRRQVEVESHAATGLAALVETLDQAATQGGALAAAGGQLAYRVPAKLGDGRDHLDLVWESA